MSGLFKDSPSEFEKRIDRLIGHFRHAEYLFELSGSRRQKNPRDLLWLLFVEAYETEKVEPNKERRMLVRMPSSMPSKRTTDNETFSVETSRLESGMSQYDDVTPRLTVQQDRKERGTDIIDLLRFVKAGPRGKLVKRYIDTFRAYALGESIEVCTRVWDKHRVEPLSRQSLNDIKQRILGQVLLGIQQDFGLVRTGRGFRRLTVREIEARKKAAKRARQQAKADAEEHADVAG